MKQMFSPEELGQLYVHEITLSNDDEAVVVYSAESKPYQEGMAVSAAVWKDNKAISCGYHMSIMQAAYRNCGPIYRGGNASNLRYFTVASGTSTVVASTLPPFNIGSDIVKPLKDVEQF